MNSTLHDIAEAMVAKGKGILAADESTGTIKKRFELAGIESTSENRRKWRQLLFTTPRIKDYISGVIMYDETVRQVTDENIPFCEYLSMQGIIPGIKVDKSTHPLACAPNEVVTEGLDGLRGRLQEYREMGAKFAKWRAVISIGDHIPSSYCLRANAHALARYAALSQDEGIVPIVEPEVLMDGVHSIDECFSVTEWTLHRVFHELYEQRVDLEGMILKPNMVLSGKDAAERASTSKVAEATLTCFARSVPAAVPGIAFLSGGQSDEEATVNLDAINKLKEKMNAPWEMTFSYGRGLQSTPLRIWGGSDEQVAESTKAFIERCRKTALAREGKYL